MAFAVIGWTALKVVPPTLIGLVTWEHIARKNESNIKPSVAITKCVEPAQQFWNFCGTQLAKLSSFYTYLKHIFGGLDQSIYDLFSPMFQLLFSWTNVIKGYLAQANVYNHPGLIVIGTITLALLLACGSMFAMKYTGYGANYVDTVMTFVDSIKSKSITS